MAEGDDHENDNDQPAHSEAAQMIALIKTERFIAGFEGDELRQRQEPQPACMGWARPRLRRVRAASHRRHATESLITKVGSCKTSHKQPPTVNNLTKP